jgi:predicted Fe-Mo cluster-binding NifX family protein
MRICVPTSTDAGLTAPVHGHFGSAPFFTLVDEDGGNLKVIPNQNDHSQHGMCSPLGKLQGEEFDAMVVAGMGRRAMQAIQASGAKVLLAAGPTIQANLDALKAGTLGEMPGDHACEGHH